MLYAWIAVAGSLLSAVERVAVPNFDMVGWHDHCNGDMLLHRTMVAQAADQTADAELTPATQTVHHGGARATRVVLPWVPGRADSPPTP